MKMRAKKIFWIGIIFDKGNASQDTNSLEIHFVGIKTKI